MILWTILLLILVHGQIRFLKIVHSEKGVRNKHQLWSWHRAGLSLSIPTFNSTSEEKTEKNMGQWNTGWGNFSAKHLARCWIKKNWTTSMPLLVSNRLSGAVTGLYHSTKWPFFLYPYDRTEDVCFMVNMALCVNRNIKILSCSPVGLLTKCRFGAVGALESFKLLRDQ